MTEPPLLYRWMPVPGLAAGTNGCDQLLPSGRVWPHRVRWGRGVRGVPTRARRCGVAVGTRRGGRRILLGRSGVSTIGVGWRLTGGLLRGGLLRLRLAAAAGQEHRRRHPRPHQSSLPHSASAMSPEEPLSQDHYGETEGPPTLYFVPVPTPTSHGSFLRWIQEGDRQSQQVGRRCRWMFDIVVILGTQAHWPAVECRRFGDPKAERHRPFFSAR